MKLPSIIRTKKNKRFDYQPRYFNEQKDGIESRVARAKREKERNAEEYKSISFQGTFERKATRGKGVNYLQLFLLFLFLITAFGYLWVGDDIFVISFFVCLPAYLFYRFQKIKIKAKE